LSYNCKPIFKFASSTNNLFFVKLGHNELTGGTILGADGGSILDAD